MCSIVISDLYSPRYGHRYMVISAALNMQIVHKFLITNCTYLGVLKQKIVGLMYQFRLYLFDSLLFFFLIHLFAALSWGWTRPSMAETSWRCKNYSEGC